MSGPGWRVHSAGAFAGSAKRDDIIGLKGAMRERR
jgi:hypothetical protein